MNKSKIIDAIGRVLILALVALGFVGCGYMMYSAATGRLAVTIGKTPNVACETTAKVQP